MPASVVFALSPPLGVCELKDLKLDEEDMFVSHDVVSLFTNTPIPQSIEIIKNRLQKDKSLKKRTLLTPDDIVELLNFIRTTTYFVFRGQVYQQKFGTAMGSPVSPIVDLIYGRFGTAGNEVCTR